MARKKTTQASEAAAKPGPKPKPSGPLPNVVSMRGQPEWRDWLSRVSVKLRATPSALIDRALAELAKREGLEEPPPRL